MSDIVLISESVLQHFFHAFVEWGTLTYGWRIQAPRDTADIARAEHVYRQLGLPGCCSSTDGVHVAWMRAPSVLSHLYVGKEGFPTLQFNVSCDHTLKIVHVAGAQPGARNDKTCIRFDEYCSETMMKEPYSDFQFTLDTENGQSVHKGAWTIVDGGYHKWKTTINGMSLPSTTAERMWTQAMESIRKDIERVFGILKVVSSALPQRSALPC